MKQERLVFMFLLMAVTVVMLCRFQQIDHMQTMEWGYVNAGAINPYYGTYPPLGYRPLMPVLLNLMGDVPKAGEPLIPISAVVVMCMTFYWFLRIFGIPLIEAVMGTVFLSCSPGITDLLKEFCINHVDTASHILIVIALIGIIKKNHTLFSIATIVGTFNREWALTLIPAWYVYHYGFSVNKQSILLMLRVAVPSVLVYVMVRYVYYPNTALGVMAHDVKALLPASEGSMFGYYYQEFLLKGWAGFRERVFSNEFYTFGMIALIQVYLSLWKTIDRRWLYVSVYYVLVCLLQLLIAADVWRLAFYLFPIIVTAFVQWLVLINQDFDRKTQWILFLPILYIFILKPTSMYPQLIVLGAVIAVMSMQKQKRISEEVHGGPV